MSDQSGSWQPDPFGRHQYRYWNGTEWTDQVSDDGVVSSDPATAEGAGATTPGVPTEPDPTQVGGWGAAPADPTISQPAAVAPAASPATATSSSGNKPALILGGVLLVALLGAGGWLLFGGSDDDDGPDRASLISALRDQGLSGEEATCVLDEVGEDVVHELDTNPDGASAAEVAAFNTAIAECQGSGQAAETTTTTEDDDPPETTTTTSGSTGGGGVSNAELEAFMEGFMSTSGLAEDDARCFAEEFLGSDVIDVTTLTSPEAILANPSAMALMQQIMVTCNIDPGLISGGSSGTGGGTSGGLLPGHTYGDNPVLDAMWDDCEAGDLDRCHELYMSSEFGSEYEEFGLYDGQVP